MAVVSYGASTELDAVNSILMSVGESPVNTLNVQSPEVAIAQKALQQVCREVLSEGWVFNTEKEYAILLDSNNHGIVPNNVLKIDGNPFKHLDHLHLVKRKDSGVEKLYDLHAHSFDISDVGDTVYVDIIWMQDFNDIPEVFKDYITLRASRIASNRMVNDPQAAQLLGQDEQLARAAALEYDTQQSGYNIFADQQGRTNPASHYRPYKVLQRR